MIQIIELSKITNVQVEGIDWKDYPEFTMAFISFAMYEGRPLTDEQLDIINQDCDFVYSQVWKNLH